MLTYDTMTATPPDGLREMLRSRLPDIIDVGESDTYWITVSRSKKHVYLRSKQTGAVVTRCGLDDLLDLGLTEQQMRAARQAVAL